MPKSCEGFLLSHLWHFYWKMMRQHDTLLGSKCLPVPLPDDLSVWENYSGLNAGEAKVSGPHAGHLEVGKLPFYRLNSAKQQSSNLPIPISLVPISRNVMTVSCYSCRLLRTLELMAFPLSSVWELLCTAVSCYFSARPMSDEEWNGQGCLWHDGRPDRFNHLSCIMLIGQHFRQSTIRFLEL